MYIDQYIISGLIIIAATCVATGAIAYYGWKHIKQDMKEHPGE
jgi:hypothetical protein